MRVTKGTDYAIRALIDLAEHVNQGPVQGRDIASRRSIPDSFLDQILRTLRLAGIIRTTRGPKGGHILAIPPGKIPLADVLAAIEGSPSTSSCAEGPDQCYLSGQCLLQEVWRNADQAALQVLKSTTIADLLIDQQKHASFQMYHI